MVDTNSDRFICRKEIEASFRQKGKLLSDEELEDIFSRVDMDGNGFINYWEFLAATMNSSTMLCNENLKVAFEMFDKNKSDSITAEDLKSVFRGHASSTTTSQEDKDTGEIPLIEEGVIDAIIQQVDQNGNGEISYDEFVNMMQENIMPPKRPRSSLE